jgi:hypothetical protein
MAEHGIKVHNASVLPFSDRLQEMCLIENAYLYYKNNRVEILADKKAYEIPEEPFHKKMLREEEEKRWREARARGEEEPPKVSALLEELKKKSKEK